MFFDIMPAVSADYEQFNYPGGELFNRLKLPCFTAIRQQY